MATKLMIQGEQVQGTVSEAENVYFEKPNGDKLPLQDMINIVYPVGSVYMSVNNISPQTFFGGKWEAISNGYYLKAITSGTGGAYANASNVGSTAITVNQMPNHTHYMAHKADSGIVSGHVYQATSVSGATMYLSGVDGGTNYGGGYVSKTGGGQTHTHSMGTPATVSVYMWKRTE